MVADAGLSEAITGTSLANARALPADIGRTAQAASVHRVVLSHLMSAPSHTANCPLWSLTDLDHTVDKIAS